MPDLTNCQAQRLSDKLTHCARCMQMWPTHSKNPPICRRLTGGAPAVFLVSRERIECITHAPTFGIAFWSLGVALVRDDLPKSVQRAVAIHELNHLQNGDRGNFWANEAPAWLAQIKAEPLGTVLAVLMSLSPRRLAWYARRIFVNNH